MGRRCRVAFVRYGPNASMGVSFVDSSPMDELVCESQFDTVRLGSFLSNILTFAKPTLIAHLQ